MKSSAMWWTGDTNHSGITTLPCGNTAPIILDLLILKNKTRNSDYLNEVPSISNVTN